MTKLSKETWNKIKSRRVADPFYAKRDKYKKYLDTYKSLNKFHDVVYAARHKLSGQIYIGCTRTLFTDRIRGHICHANNPEVGVNKFHCLMRKDGYDSFDWHILYCGEQTKEIENHLIYYYRPQLNDQISKPAMYQKDKCIIVKIDHPILLELWKSSPFNTPNNIIEWIEPYNVLDRYDIWKLRCKSTIKKPLFRVKVKIRARYIEEKYINIQADNQEEALKIGRKKILNSLDKDCYRECRTNVSFVGMEDF